MRARKLVIQAFGPFVNKVEIDFDNFGNNGIYLISGDTGAGKTTIFDAISFALFDSSSGGKRESKMFRSTFADDDVDTFVEYIFEYRNKEYRIIRNPQYMRKSKRGSGLTEQKSDANLYLPSGDIVSGVTGVNRYIENLLGVNEIQFKQIVMLAQGDFLRLIHSKNEDRQELFRKIFSTEKYSELEQKIKNLYSELKTKFEILKRDFKNVVSEIEIEGYEASENWKFGDEILEKLDIWLKMSEDELEKNKERGIKLQKEITDNSILIENVINYYKNKDLISKLRERNEELNREYLELEEKSKNIPKLNEQRLQTEKNLIKYRNDLKELNILDEIIKEIGKIKTEIKKIDCLESDLTEIENSYKKEISKINDFVEKNLGCEVGLINDINLIKEYEKKTLDLINTKKEYSSYSDQLKTIEVLKKRFEEDCEKIQKLELKRMGMENLYFTAQAGILASNLIEGEKCPVCGSTNHPEKAKLSGDVPNRDEIEKIKLEIDEFSGKREMNSSRLSRMSGENAQLLKKIQDNLSKLEIDILSIEELDLLILKTETEKETVFKSLENHKKIKSLVESGRKKIPELNKLLEENSKKIQENKLKKAALIERQKSLEEQAEKKKKEITDLDVSGIKKIIKNSENELKKISEFVEKVREDFEKSKIDIAKNQENIKSVSKSLDDKFSLDLNELDIKSKNLNIEINSAREQYKNLSIQMSKNLNIRNKLSELISEISLDSVSLSDVSDIYQTVTGRIPGKDNIKFEVYVQMKFFEEIINRSNVRFIEMTNGKFRLKRKKISDNKTSQAGLEFEVFDTNSGKCRDIKTLSGGESFQAALSLALGLSDTVQMNSGGVEINNMFVDEGFGTLDSESLNKVMRSLFKLSESNKLIGIISHVEKLKEAIDKKIIVTKSKDGTSSVQAS